MTGTLKDWIAERLEAELAPTALDVTDESHLHAGHSGARPEGETHFRLDVVSAAFEGRAGSNATGSSTGFSTRPSSAGCTPWRCVPERRARPVEAERF